VAPTSKHCVVGSVGALRFAKSGHGGMSSQEISQRSRRAAVLLAAMGTYAREPQQFLDHVRAQLER